MLIFDIILIMHLKIKMNKVAIAVLFVLFLSPLPHSNASWDPYENLRIALGNWTPTPIFKIESSNQTDGAYIYIKGNSTQIFTELEKKKAELLFLSTQIQQLNECKITICYKIVENTDGLTTSSPLTNAEIDESLNKLIYEQKILDKFIDYAELKLINKLPQIKLALEVEIIGGKTELKDFRDNIITMINSGEIKPLGKAQDFIEIKLSDAYPNTQFQNSFEFSGTINQIKEKLDEAKLKVSETLENLTGIRAVFSEFGGKISWDISNATSWVGITEETPKAQVDAYVALKELSVFNYYAEKKIIEGALFKPTDQRTELENKIIQANTSNIKNALEIILKQKELGKMISAQQLEKFAPSLLANRDEAVKIIESLKNDSQMPGEIRDKKILEYDEILKSIDDRLSTLRHQAEGKNHSKDGGITWYDGDTEIINEYLDQLRILSPESSDSEIKSIVDQVNQAVGSDFAKYEYTNRLSELELGLSNARNYLEENTRAAKEWQVEAIAQAQKNISEIKDYWESLKNNAIDAIARIANDYEAQGLSKEEAIKLAEIKYTGVLPNLETQEKQALDGATKWYESIASSVVQESLSEIAIQKFGLDQVQEKIEFIQDEIDTLIK
jgi:hypothetical protein